MNDGLLLTDVHFVLLDERQTLSLHRARLADFELPYGSNTGSGTPGKKLCLHLVPLGFMFEVGLKGLSSIKRKVDWA